MALDYISELSTNSGFEEAVISHEAAFEEIMAIDYHGVTPEVVIGGKIPVMTSEYCFIGDYCS